MPLSATCFAWRLGRRTRWFQSHEPRSMRCSSISSARAGGLCGLVGYAGFAMTEVPRYLTCVSYHVAHGKVTSRVASRLMKHILYCSVRNHIHSHAKPAPLRANGCCYYTHSTLHMAEPPHCAIGWCCYTHLDTPNPAPHWLKEAQHAPPPPDPNPSPVAVRRRKARRCLQARRRRC